MLMAAHISTEPNVRFRNPNLEGMVAIEAVLPIVGGPECELLASYKPFRNMEAQP